MLVCSQFSRRCSLILLTLPPLAGSANATWFNSYHKYSEHLQFLDDLHAQYPSQSQVVSAGNSLKGNAITGIHFWGKSGKGKPAVVFHGTVHAREWISTMVSCPGNIPEC